MRPFFQPNFFRLRLDGRLHTFFPSDNLTDSETVMNLVLEHQPTLFFHLSQLLSRYLQPAYPYQASTTTVNQEDQAGVVVQVQEANMTAGQPMMVEDNQNFGNNLHVKGLSHKVDNRDLEAAFAKTGRVQKAQVVYDPHTRESRGFGFVTMESPEEAQAAITALNATELFGKVITVEKVRVEAVPEPLHQENTADHQKEIPLENGHMILDHLIVATPVAEAGATMKTEEGIETEIIIEAETTITEGTEITIGNDVMVAITTMAGDTRSLSQTETHCCLYL
ncbi:hypothetical protein WG66_003191 [Moniliophthora roreri]|nr:hypothetical protein WG66_003191 [Moniliophthora roreri]